MELELKPIPKNAVVKHGSHNSRKEGACVMEWVSIIAGEPFSDSPACSCPVITRFAQVLNDRMGSGKEADAMRTELLLPLVPVIAGSKSTPEVESRRRWMGADWAVRVASPLALRAAARHPRCTRAEELKGHADRLQALPEVTRENWEAARAACREARADAAAAAADAAYAARREVFALAAGLLRRMCEVKPTENQA